jgi:adenylate cyclase
VALRSFRSRLIAFLVGLLVVTLSIFFLTVNQANVANTVRVVSADLGEDAAVFRRLLSDRTHRLLEAARLLSSDYAFKVVYSDGDPETILSAMKNFLSRTGDADVMLLVSLDGEVLADTAEPENRGRPGPWPWLLEAAEGQEWGEAAGIVFRRERPLQMMVVPLLAPDLEAWIFIGFQLDDEYAGDLGQLIVSEVSVLHEAKVGCRNVASTLGGPDRERVARLFEEQRLAREGISTLRLGAEEYLSSVLPLAESPEGQVLVVLQRALAAEMAPYRRLRWTLLGLFLGSLGLSVVAAVAVARSVTRPVLELAAGVRSIGGGDYSRRVKVGRQDEIGQLAASFNQMAEGLADKERVRDLLGKGVSPAIADEWLSKKIELGGEERVVTILFSDVRNFTSLCEGRSPQEILSLLNLYLTEVSAIIDEHGGVVDKYIGDAVMALFGAPLDHGDNASRAVATALAMVRCLEGLNEGFRRQGLPCLGIGIGINTDLVVAGNMGSENRLNYTVIGDGVNLASRLEGLTKKYGVAVIASDSTRQGAADFVFRQLDRVRVKGKEDAVSIHQPLGRRQELAAEVLASVERFHEAQQLLLARRWAEAAEAFRGLSEEEAGTVLYRVYEGRALEFLERPPPESWDGTVEFSEK